MPMPVAWALQGPPGAPRPPLPPSGSQRSDRRDLDGGRGGRNPRGSAARCAAVEDSMGRRYTGGSPPVVPVRPRLYRRGRNPHWSIAGLSAVLPRSSALAVKDRQGQNEGLRISPIKERTKESLNDGERPKVKEKRKEVTVVEQSSSEEKDLTKEESTSEAESKREAKLKRKRIPNRRYSGPEWAYVVNDDWTDEFVSLSIENEEEEEIPIEKKSFMDSVD
ncbi:hypothetical protein NDU88_003062 [Pleurodeles waltl]|uniref:Uncharacterized protein n=1 Tax=Pleurodeles waltl TaxID=8319 RepID=A0AAV7NFI9_PLEWA|nr:hypothetical protein NDU88_003062 [Pleurodeles waltl]